MYVTQFEVQLYTDGYITPEYMYTIYVSIEDKIGVLIILIKKYPQSLIYC